MYESQIRRIITETMTATESIDLVDVDAELSNVGIDSLRLVQIIVNIEEALDLEFPDDKLTLAESGTIFKLCNIVESLKD